MGKIDDNIIILMLEIEYLRRFPANIQKDERNTFERQDHTKYKYYPQTKPFLHLADDTLEKLATCVLTGLACPCCGGNYG